MPHVAYDLGADQVIDVARFPLGDIQEDTVDASSAPTLTVTIPAQAGKIIRLDRCFCSSTQYDGLDILIEEENTPSDTTRFHFIQPDTYVAGTTGALRFYYELCTQVPNKYMKITITDFDGTGIPTLNYTWVYDNG